MKNNPFSTLLIVTPTTSGVAMITCAMIIALIVNNQRRSPNGPLRERNRNTTRPTTTGGSPIPV